MPRCPACGADVEAGARFCDACGAQLTPGPDGESAARKVVTIVFADLMGSTSLQERLDAESTRRVMERYYAAMRGAVEAHGGTVVQLLGDGVMCAFGVPHVAEDDALRAVRGAIAMQAAFREFKREEGQVVGNLGLRIAINTGEVVVSAERPQGIGDPLNVAGRLQQEAREGDVLIGESTRRLVADQVTLAHFGTFALKGRAEPVPAYRVESLERPPGAPAIAFVGREEELRRLTALFDAAVAAPGARLAAILGSPGLGKSRLLGELARRLGERATVLTARCDAAGGATFAPLADSLRTFLGIDAGASADALRAAIADSIPPDEPERARIAAGVAMLLSGAPPSPEETFFVVRRFLAGLAAKQPVVLALDDVQWAEPLLLDLAEHLVHWGAGSPLLVLVAARPELRDTRTSLAMPGGFVSDVLTLGGLDAGAATRLAANVIGADALPSAIAGRVLATSEGNPLFVGELVRMLVQDGALKREGDRWTAAAALAEVAMPPTIHALLAARIERLRPEERAVLERAAVVGRHFSRAAVAQLLPPREVDELDARLESLRRSELIEPDTGWFLGDPVLRFHHALIRDAAYRRVLRGTRAELHARIANWIVERAGDSVEHDETIGWHLEQAHQQLRELGPIDARGRELGERAAQYLAAAGRRALARDDVPVAGSLLGRAFERLDLASPGRAELALDWCEALLAAGDVGPAALAIAELGRFTSDSPRLRAWHTCFSGQLAALTDPESLRETAAAVASAAETLAAAGDTAGEAKAHSVHALALARLGKGAACEAALDRALAAARRAHDRRLANAVLAGAPLAALWGPSPVTRASGRCLDVVRVLRITQGAPAVEAVALRCQALLESLRGRSDAAHRMIASSRRMVEELGLTQQLLETEVFSGHVDLLEGDTASAERALRGAYDGLREHGLGIDAARAAALLARALLAQGRADEADALSRESESLAGDDLQAAIAWRGVRAEALARRGEHALAVDFARAAVDIASGTDALLHHADARIALAVALRAAGRGAEADTEVRRAIELWEAKGATLLAERASRAAPAARHSSDSSRPRSLRRPVRANAASEYAARLDAVIAARDSDALPSLFADEVAIVHHPTGTEFGREGALHRHRALLRAKDLSYGHLPIATLGDSLALCDAHTAVTALSDDDVAPAGPIHSETRVLVEVDARGRQTRAEIFAHDRLAEAIARLYRRHGELLPEGPERARAAAVARSVAGQLGLDEVSDPATHRVDELLALRSDGLVARRTLPSGQHIELCCFGDGGEVTHLERFDPGEANAALTRFDSLAAASPAKRARRVRANAAAEHVARLGGHEPVATLGDSLVLCAIQTDGYALVDAGEGGERLRESFAQDRLADALARLYQRHAESLAAGPAQRRAAATARALAVQLGPPNLGDYGSAFADDVSWEDHRTMGFGSMQGREALMRGFRALFEMSSDLAIRVDDVLGLEPNGLLMRWTVTGADRTSGGAFERHFLQIWICGPDGRVQRVEQFDADREAEALARFEELAAESAKTRVTRRFRPNAATASAARTDAALMVEHEPLATLGDSLALFRRYTQPSPRSGDAPTLAGSSNLDAIALLETDSQGRRARTEFFAADRLGDAIVRLCQRYAESLPPGPARERAMATAATASLLTSPFDVQRFAETHAREVPVVDHRPLGLAGARGLLSWLASLSETADDLAMRIDDVLAFREDVLLLLTTSWGRLRAGGGAFEQAIVQLFVVGANGRIARVEWFDPDQVEAALARFDEIAAAESVARSFANAASRTTERFERAWRERDWAGVVATYLPNHRMDDRRKLMRMQVSGEEFFANERMLFDETASQWSGELLATRGERLALLRMHFTAEVQGSGPMAVEMLDLVEVDADGRRAALVVFDLDDLDAAYAELDRRHEELTRKGVTPHVENAATRTIEQFQRAWAARDREAAFATLAPGFRQVDRRRLMRLDLDRDEFMAFNSETYGMSSSRLESEILATRGDRLALARLMFKGADHSRGPTEIESLGVIETDEHGNRLAMVRFDAGDLDAAYAELDLRYGAGEAAPHASCWETMCRFRLAVAARDWAELDSVFAPELVFEDHRVMGWGTLRSRDELVARFRALVELAPDAVLRADHVLALDARGALVVGRWVGSRDGGGFEIPTASVRVLAPDGRISHFHIYDLEQLDLARACFDALETERATPSLENVATRTMARIYGYLKTREWEQVTAWIAPDFRMFDVRSLVHLELDWAQQLESLRAVASMSSWRLTWEPFATRGERLALARGRFSGAEELSSGPSEVEWLSVAEVNGAGAVVATVMFNPEDFEGAYAELERRHRAGEGAPRPSDSLAAHAAPNLATAAMDRAHAAFVARDWAALRRAWAASATFEDRRRHMLLSLDADRWLADVQETVGASPDASIERRLTCTAGERVAIERRISRGGSAGGLQGPYEIETLWLFETDEHGLIVSAVLFDPSDWRTAEREAWARWLARDAEAAAVMRPIFELTDAFNDHDRARLRAVLADDVVTHDHRLAGLGRFRGADRLVESLASEWALTPSVQQSAQFQVARERHGAVGLSRLFGTSPEGAPFEDLLATVALVAGGRIARLEVFELANLDQALARFAELR